MKKNIISRRKALRNVGALGAAGVVLPGVAACNAETPAKRYTYKDLDLSTPEKRSAVVAKVMGSIAEEEKHAFMRFHIYGYLGDGNLVPFFSMNNYLVQRWKPDEDASFAMQHYEVGYYCEFDTDTPIETWKNPVTGETIELEHFILGPIDRLYTPEGIIAPGIAPNPLRINVIGDRVFMPAQSIESFPNMFSPEEWPELSSGPEIFWDSMYTYSASLKDVLDPDVTAAPAEIHMQNFTSWQPFLGFAQHPGRTMVRAFGTNISGFDELEPQVRAAFEKYTPDIFDTDNWQDVRFDSMDYYNKMIEKRKKEGKE